MSAICIAWHLGQEVADLLIAKPRLLDEWRLEEWLEMADAMTPSSQVPTRHPRRAPKATRGNTL